ncbi:uncharacterized protein LOC124443517 [Xenia sp. Carnegie-2017]|uniref:uncharacterized protein LOC124443517 n=1 Tax=Xenia sp. Carnegie-2017 TaxID=2897299 RepID=UPI001F04E55B|nr:uncharacterized protein LOC124443517 [Xenia sp. Carnegie-2017]
MQKFTEDKLTSHDQIPKYILQMLMMANYHVREFTLEGINPMDALLGIFHCSDNFLRQYIAVKLSECQLSVPFILPDPDDPVEKQTILLSALGKITKSWRGASINDSAKEVYATEHPFPIVSFIRLGNVTMSKSSLLNKIISDGNGDHEFFFHKNMEGGDFVRRVVDGLVELVWYLPGGCDKNMLKNEICFANLRGNAQNFKKQVNILREISNILCILLPSEMPDKRVENFLEKAMSSKSKIVLIFNENMRKEVKNYYDGVIDQHSTKLYSFTKSLMTSDYRFLKSIRQKIQSNIKETEVKSLEKVRLLSQESGVYVDYDQANVEWDKTFKTWLSFGIEETKKWFKLQLHIPVLADLERKKHNPKFPLNNENTSRENVVIEPYEDIRKEKKAQMESFQKMDTEIRHFLNSIAVMDERMLNRNLQRLKYLFDKASLSAMAKLHHQYRLKLQETHNDMLDSQSQEENRLKDLEALISYSLFGLEHIVRELAQLHQLSDFVINNYASAGAKILLSGHPLELLDGDSGYLPLTWFDAVYKEVERETNNARICVISVLGIQNSGKSAMLNAMFGLEFPVNGRKCTRGAFVCLVPLSDQLKSDSNLDFLLIIDTEGLRRRVDPTVREHSIELATFVIGVADVTIVNIFGEKHNEIIEFLNMVVRAFLKMKLLKEKKNYKILYQNVSATKTEENFKANWQNLKHDLDKMAKLAAAQENCEDQFQKFDDIIAFDENKDMFYIPNLLKGSPPMAPVNPNYGIAVQEVKESIIELMWSEKLIKLTVSSFRERVKSFWKAILKGNFNFSARNIFQVKANISREKNYFEKSVKLIVNGMAEVEQEIQRELRRCTTREERDTCWKKSKKYIVDTAEELKTKMEDEMRTICLNNEDGSTTLEQWKKDMMHKIFMQKRSQEMSVITSCEATFNYLQQRQDVEEMQQSYEKQLLDKADNLMSDQNANEEEEFLKVFALKIFEESVNITKCEEEPVNESKQTIDSKNLDDFNEEDKEGTHAKKNQKESVMEENRKSFQDDGEYMKDMREFMQITEKNNLDNFDEKKRNEEDSNTKNVEVESESMVEDNSDDFNKENKNEDDKHGEHVEDESVKEENVSSTKDARQSIEGSEESNAKLGETLSQLCARLNLNVESKLTLKHARTVDNHMFNGDELTSTDQIPGYILKTLMIADYHVRELTFKPLNSNKSGEVSNELNEDTGSDASDSDSESGNEIESVERINPMDALIGIFYCSDIFLRQDLAVKLTACQLSVPFILPHPEMPAERVIILLSTLEKITKSWKGASSEDTAKEVYATEHPFPVVSFIRLGNVTISKSSMMNKIISDNNGDHEFFFHKNIEGGDFERKVVDGLVELVWYLPGRCDKNTLKNEICFANLRGDAQNFKKQVDILREISNIFCILLPSEMPDERMENFLKEALLCKGKIILIFNKKRREESKKFYNCLKNQHSKKLSLFTKAQKTNEFIFLQTIRNAIQSNINESEVKSLVNLRLLPEERSLYLDDKEAYVEAFGKTVETWFPWCNEKAKKLFKLQLHVPALADLERRKHNPSLCRNIKTVTDLNKVYEDIGKEKKAQMESLAKMDENVLHFLKSLAVMNENELVRRLHQLKYLLDKVSLSEITKLHQQYRQKKSKNYNSQCEEEERLRELEESISHTSFGLEHIFRELTQLYQLKNDVTIDYTGAAANILLSGEPLELLDGDSGYLPLEWFDAVYKKLERKTNNARIYVISVLGIQSSGKSTMLNTMFGLEFPVSAGRCTRGAFASLVPLSEQLKCDSNFDYVLIIDTEGLKGMADPIVREHDNELATFAVGVADVTIVTIFGENYNEMKEFLAMAVHAFLKMKLVKDKKSCKIVHQNVAANDAADKLMMDRRNLKQNLNHMARLAAIQENCEDQFQTLDHIMAFDENKDVFYIPSLLKGSPPMAPINPNYGRDLQKVKENIIQLMCSKEVVKLTVSSFRNRVKGLWQAMLKENFIFSFRNVIEIRAYASLDKKLFKESVKLLVNGMAEIERSIERDLKRCTTRQERKGCWISSKSRIIEKAEELKTKMEKEMQTFFESSEDKSTLEQWKEDVMVKIKTYKRNQEASVIENCEATFHHLQQQQDVEEMKKNYEKQLLERAKYLVSTQRTNDKEEYNMSKAYDIKNIVISKGQQFAERVSNIAVRFTNNDLKAMYNEIISTIDKETEKQKMKFKKPLVCDILLYTFARAFPIFDKMEERYLEERDIQ